MPNKTIYISESDAALFEEAKELAGESLSSVISRALKEFIAKNKKKADRMKEISVKIGHHNSQREQRFIGQEVGKWSGFSDDKEWWMHAKIYHTQKGNWAILLSQTTKATLLTNPKGWEKNADYLVHTNGAELIVGKDLTQLQEKLPKSLFETMQDIAQGYETPVEYLDI